MKNDQDSASAKTDAPRQDRGRHSVSIDKAFRRTGNHNQALLNEQILILHDRHLSHLDQGPVMAFAAKDVHDNAESPYFALISEPYLVPRISMSPQIAGMAGPGFAHLIASGVCYWPPAQAERYVLVYENTLGQPLLKGGEAGMGWKAETVMQSVIKPTVNVLTDLRDADVFHGGIRASNLYDGGAKVLERVILGDCLSVPPSYNQPVLYETIERGMADPLARGRGTFMDDIYSFGVTLAVLLRHKDPLEGLSGEEVIKAKLESGSFAALIPNERFAGAILELLRGLLQDDMAQRWTLAEVMSWLDGQRLSPKQAGRKLKAARPLEFNGEKYFRPAALAMDIYKNQAELVQIVEDDALTQWVERSLEDRPTGVRLEQATLTAQEGGRGPGYWDRLSARVSVALDPTAPIRYKGLNMNADGVATAMADTLIRKKDPQPFIDIINQQLVMYWVTIQDDSQVDIGALVSRFDNCRAFLRQPTLGYGIERCLYFLCHDAPCISDVLKGYYVSNPEDLMFALEDIAKKPGRPHLFIDRHIAAFLSVKEKRVIDPFFIELNAPEFHRRVLGNINVVATLQKRFRMDSLPGMTAWAADILKPVYERFHDRDLREKLKAKVSKAVEAGDLGRIVAILDDMELRHNDISAFRSAMGEYKALMQEAKKLENDLENPKTFGRDIGQEYAAVASAIVAAIIILAVVFIYFTHSGLL